MVAALTSCGTKNTTTNETTTSKASMAADSTPATGGPMQCYALTTDSDTVRLSVTRQDSDVSGTLYYQFAGKDKNTGTLSGQMRGDTLLADYTFQSEGVESRREVAFLAKDGGFVEGYGPVREVGRKMTFTPNAPLTFGMDRILTKTTCPNE